MTSSWSRKLAWGIIWILCTLALFVTSAELDPLQPQGELGLSLDRSLALNWPPREAGARMGSRHWFYSSYLTFNKPVAEITDGQLWKMALDAYAEIDGEMSQYGIKKTSKNIPGAMTVMAFGNEIIIASSQKGKKSFSFLSPNTEATKALNKCQAVWEKDYPDDKVNNAHRREGKCGEPMAAHLYYLLRKDEKGNLRDEKARVCTVAAEGSGMVRKPPCGSTDNPPFDWGCNKFVEEMNLTPLDESVAEEEYDLSKIAGGLRTRDQIQLCSGTG